MATRKTPFVKEIIEAEGRGPAALPVLRTAAIAIVDDLFAGRFVENLSELIDLGRALGARLMLNLVGPRDGTLLGYGKSALSVAVCCCLIGVATAAMGRDATDSSSTLFDLRRGLEDKRFVGSLKIEDETVAGKEVLTFKDGEFTSDVCLKYGFDPAPYWVRRDGEGLHFLAELVNPENGTIRFEGVFDGKSMRATALWTKERWYWTLEQTLVFNGQAFEQAE